MPRADLMRLYARAAGIGILLYLPWILWAWWYYGTPVPHTIVAKGLHQFTNYKDRLIHFPRTYWYFDRTFGPAYYTFGGWPFPVRHLYGVLAFICSWYWLLPRARPFARAASLAFLVGHLYLHLIVPTAYPWYHPAVAVLGFIVVGAIVQDITDRLARRGAGLSANAAVLLPLALVTGHFCLLCAVAYQLHNQEDIIEQHNRKQIGLWLRDHAATPHDTVFMECRGYIGFYSNLKTYDYPGMSSPEMVAARRTLDTEDWSKLIAYLRPDWVVMRPKEEAEVAVQDATLTATQYAPVQVFDVSAQVAAVPHLPGRLWVGFDQKFTVYHRLSSPLPKLPSGSAAREQP